jgi:AcrR family transcriptional regulator
VYNWSHDQVDAHNQADARAHAHEQADAMSKRAEQGRATREHLLEVATRLFAEQGYEDTSIEDVLTAAGVSRGALYHHFPGKEALFEACYTQIEDRMSAGLLAIVVAAPSATAALSEAALAWIDQAANPVVQRIVLIDAPSVLGWERWRIQGGQAVGQIKSLLQLVADEGHLTPGLVSPFAHMILAALDETALVIAQADDPQSALAEGRAAVEELLRRLIAP